MDSNADIDPWDDGWEDIEIMPNVMTRRCASCAGSGVIYDRFQFPPKPIAECDECDGYGQPPIA